MHKLIYTGLTAAAIVVLPTLAFAQDAAAGAAGGAVVGGVTGAIVGGPVGAAVGAGVGATVGAGSSDTRTDRVIVEERRAPTVTERTCVEGRNTTECVETRR
jgi:uncharacterized protein YcfJ